MRRTGNPREIHCHERDRKGHRWELDPASSEDYGDRLRVYRSMPPGERFLKWFHEHVVGAVYSPGHKSGN